MYLDKIDKVFGSVPSLKIERHLIFVGRSRTTTCDVACQDNYCSDIRYWKEEFPSQCAIAVGLDDDHSAGIASLISFLWLIFFFPSRNLFFPRKLYNLSEFLLGFPVFFYYYFTFAYSYSYVYYFFSYLLRVELSKMQ